MAADLPVGAHVSNVLAFMSASYRFTGLADQTYSDMLTAGIPHSLVRDLYPYDSSHIVSLWERHQRPWFKRRSRWDQIVHTRSLNRYVNAVIELQRYMPSLYLNEALWELTPDEKPYLTFQATGLTLERLFIWSKPRRMNATVAAFVEDFFNAVIFIATDRAFDSVYPRQVRVNSKAKTNEGFEAALAGFFAALGRLLDIPEKH